MNPHLLIIGNKVKTVDGFNGEVRAIDPDAEKVMVYVKTDTGIRTYFGWQLELIEPDNNSAVTVLPTPTKVTDDFTILIWKKERSPLELYKMISDNHRVEWIAFIPDTYYLNKPPFLFSSGIQSDLFFEITNRNVMYNNVLGYIVIGYHN